VVGREAGSVGMSSAVWLVGGVLVSWLIILFIEWFYENG